MALKRRNKISAEFSYASMTDMIFLLLIFFVLTSNFVRISMEELPESDAKTIAPANVIVEVDLQGRMVFEGKSLTENQLKRALVTKREAMGQQEDFTVTIAAHKDAAFDHVADVIRVAGEMRVKAILATREKKS
ncbi:MAG: hypothetical protein RLY31_2476 [Bacteroidota bacterium]|jgi:biopolymer transport protein ExbD